MARAFKDPNGAARHALGLRKKRTPKKRITKKRTPSPTTIIRRLIKELTVERALHCEAVEALPIPFEWRMGSGDLIKPSSMDEDHLRNAISYVQRRLVHECGRAMYLVAVKKWAQALFEFIQEAERRGMRV